MKSENYQASIAACIECAVACNTCTNASLCEKDVNPLVNCIKLTQQCADICYLVTQFMACNSEYTSKMCAVCADICDACAIECEKHDHEHCRECATACRKTSATCREISMYSN